MLSKLSVKKPYTVIVGVILVIVLGAVSLTKMTTDLLPDMSLPYALVITTDMGASPEKVESDVTAPVEASMATTSSIKNVSSASYDNYSMVILEYEQNANMDSVIIEIQQKLDQLEGSFPDGAGKPMIMQIDPDMMPVMVASADVEGMTQSEISDYVENELSPVLESIDGVASVSTTGTVEENIHVTLDQDKIDALNQKIQSKIEEQFTEPQEQLDQAAEQVESGRRQMESGKDQLANQLGQAENEVINGKSQAFVAESDLSQNYTVLKATDELIKRAIPELQSIYEQGMGLKADIEQAQKEAQDFLIKHRSEVVGMLLEEFDMDEYIKMERRDSYEDGHEDGLAMGLAEGKRLEQLHIIHNMFQENIPAQSCAKLLDKDVTFISKVYSLCQAHPDWSDEDLYHALKEKWISL